MPTVVDHWHRLTRRCAALSLLLVLSPMTDRSRVLSRRGVTVLLVNRRLSLGERCAEVEQHLARHAERVASAG